MSNRIDSQINDAFALIKEMETHQRRKRMEREYGPIKTYQTGSYTPHRRFQVYFDNYYDLDYPLWVQAWGATEAEALDELLEQAEEHYRAQCDEAIQADLQRRAGC